MQYAARGKPVLVAGLLDNWPARQEWSRAGLLRSSGGERVVVIRSSEVTRQRVESQRNAGTKRAVAGRCDAAHALSDEDLAVTLAREAAGHCRCRTLWRR